MSLNLEIAYSPVFFSAMIINIRASMRWAKQVKTFSWLDANRSTISSLELYSNALFKAAWP